MDSRRQAMTTLGVIATLVLGSSALAEPGYRIAVPPGERRPAPSYTDPCLECDILYAADCGVQLWRIDTVIGTQQLVGTMPTNMFDIAATSDGRLIGLNSGGQLYEISACDASGVLLPYPVAGNGLAGDLNTTDLFSQGPPLYRMDSLSRVPPAAVGGGYGSPPGWCGDSTGDFAMRPSNGLLYSTLGCTGCAPVGGDRLVRIDPSSGDVIDEIGCVREGALGIGGVFGLAWDSQDVLWGGSGYGVAPLLRIDPATAQATQIPSVQICANGLASLPCSSSSPPRPCGRPDGLPPDVGDVLMARGHGSPNVAIVTADFEWSADRGAPRRPGDHYHLGRGTDPRFLERIPGTEPLIDVLYTDGTPRADALPLVHYYVELAADSCEDESLN